MKFFVDTANLEAVLQGASLGVIDGITTNPTLVAKEKRPFREHILEICKIVKDGVVDAEVVSTATEGILHKVFDQRFKHPLTDRGLEGFLKDWEKARETLGEVFEPASARQARH